MSGYSIIKDGGIKYLSFDIFNSTGMVDHAFTTRAGGVSTGPFGEMNLAAHVEDSPEAVLENRKRACAVLGRGLGDMVCGQQVHGAGVHLVTEEDRGRGAYGADGAVPAADALVTDRPGILLASFYADCVPIMILDPVKKAVGLVHAGWKGTVRRIASIAIEKMSGYFGTFPGHCLVAMAPSIGPCCYEVDRPVIGAFDENGFDTGVLAGPVGKNRWKLDLRRANRDILTGAGVRPENIVVAGLCTSCCRDFFSYRRQSGRCGRMASLIVLK
ncbi:MAG: peptidoglycan editing factor PgeF [Bacillota bacterium]